MKEKINELLKKDGYQNHHLEIELEDDIMTDAQSPVEATFELIRMDASNTLSWVIENLIDGQDQEDTWNYMLSDAIKYEKRKSLDALLEFNFKIKLVEDSVFATMSSLEECDKLLSYTKRMDEDTLEVFLIRRFQLLANE